MNKSPRDIIVVRTEPAPSCTCGADNEFALSGSGLDERSEAPPMTHSMARTVISSLLQAAAGLDTDAVSTAVSASIDSYGIIRAWEWLIYPAWQAVLAGDEYDYLAQQQFTRATSQALAAARRPSGRSAIRAVLACTPREDHVLPLEAVAGALAEAGAGSCLLGARITRAAVIAAAERLRPDVLVVWAQTAGSAAPQQLRALRAMDPDITVIAAGPGWHGSGAHAETVSAAFQQALAHLNPAGDGRSGGGAVPTTQSP